jgi:hypothetical protein
VTRLGLRPAAVKLGISHVALLKAAKAGRVQRGEDGLFDVEACVEALKTNSHPGKQASARAQQQEKPAPEAGDRSYNEACTQEKWLAVEERKLKLAQRRGELVGIAEINAYVAGMIIRARDILLRIGPELRDRLSQETDPVRCEEWVAAEVNRSLAELAEFRSGAG